VLKIDVLLEKERLFSA